MTISPVLAWFLIGIACYSIELALPGFIIFFFGIGAWTVALALTFTQLSLTGQLILFLLASIASLVLLRTKIRSVFFGEANQQDDSVTVDHSEANGIVTEAIVPPGTGRVKYGGSFWTATAEKPIPVGAVVTILDKKNLTVTVRTLETDTENTNE